MKKYIYVYGVRNLDSIITSDIDLIISKAKERMLRMYKLDFIRCEYLIRKAAEENTENYAVIYYNSYGILIRRIE